MKRTLSFSSLLLVLCACDDTTPLPILDVGPGDAGPADVSMGDSGRSDAPSMDAGAPDSGPLDSGPMDAGQPDTNDAGPPPPPSCDPIPRGECDDAEAQWFWGPGDCSARMDCPGTGYVSLGECRAAHAHCEAPDLCAGPPSFIDSCSGDDGYAWDGAACIPGCDYFTPEAQIYATQQECEHVHESCGAEGGCGPIVPLGCTRITAPFPTVFSDGDHDLACEGAADWDTQVVFVAPDEAAYEVRVQVEMPGAMRGALVGVSRGVCSTRATDFPATAACVEYDEPVSIPARTWSVYAQSHRAHTIRISPRANPDEFTALTVCVDRAE